MSFTLTFTACNASNGCAPAANIHRLNPVAHIFAGDPNYNDYSVGGAAAGFNGQPAIPDLLFDPTGNAAGGTADDVRRRWTDVFGREKGMRTWMEFWAKADAKKLPVFFMEDDHALGGWNNNDFTLGIATNIVGFSTRAATVTISIANPAVISQSGHGYVANEPIKLTTTGALPTGLVANTTYYVKSPVTNSYNLSATPGGAAIVTTGTQSGVHTATRTGMTSQADVLTQWNIGRPVANEIVAAYGANPPRAGIFNGDIPLAMQGTALADGSEFEVRYFYKDFNSDGVIGPVNPVARVIFMDYVQYKDPFGAKESGTVTVSIANPAVFTLNNHQFVAGSRLRYSTTGALPTGLVAGQDYYVIAAGLTTNTYQVSATKGGAAIVTSGTQSGTHTVTNVGKTIYGKTQLAWITQAIADAVKAGCQTVIMASTKDLFNVDNNDGPWQYSLERDALLTQIDANNWPVVWMCGDKHYPHAGIARKSNGDPYDAIAVCACPFGQGLGTLTQYKQNVWAYGRNDGTVIGSIFVDTENRATVLSIHDAFSLDVLFAATIPFGKRVPDVGGVRTSVTPVPPKTPAPWRVDGTSGITASPYTYKNEDNRHQLIVMSGGTVSQVAYSRDNAAFDILGSVTGQFDVAPGDFLKITYTVAPTVFSIYPV